MKYEVKVQAVTCLYVEAKDEIEALDKAYAKWNLMTDSEHHRFITQKGVKMVDALEYP